MNQCTTAIKTKKHEASIIFSIFVNTTDIAS